MGKSKSSTSTEVKEPQVQQNAVLILLGDIADTTWRMFIPTAGLGVLGFYLDSFWKTSPILAIAGVIIGAGLAALLVRQQLRRIKR